MFYCLCMLVCLRARTHTPHAPLPGLQAPLPPPPTTPTHTQTFTHRSGQAPATWRRAAEDVVVGVCAQCVRVALLCVACVAAHARLWAATSHDVKWAKCPVCGMSGRMMHVMHAHHACLSHQSSLHGLTTHGHASRAASRSDWARMKVQAHVVGRLANSVTNK